MILLVGRTCSGKSTIAKYLADNYGFQVVKSYTTRPMRPGEEKHADHIFIKPEDVCMYKDKFIAYTKIGEYEYFATSDMVNDNSVYIIDPNGVKYFENKNPSLFYKSIVIYLHVNKFQQILRTFKRGSKIKETFNRMASEENQFIKFEDDLWHSDFYEAYSLHDVDNIIYILAKRRKQRKKERAIRYLDMIQKLYSKYLLSQQINESDYKVLMCLIEFYKECGGSSNFVNDCVIRKMKEWKVIPDDVGCNHN